MEVEKDAQELSNLALLKLKSNYLHESVDNMMREYCLEPQFDQKRFIRIHWNAYAVLCKQLEHANFCCVKTPYEILGEEINRLGLVHLSNASLYARSEKEGLEIKDTGDNFLLGVEWAIEGSHLGTKWIYKKYVENRMIEPESSFFFYAVERKVWPHIQSKFKLLEKTNFDEIYDGAKLVFTTYLDVLKSARGLEER